MRFMIIFLNIKIVSIHHLYFNTKLFLQNQREIKQKLTINRNSVKNK